MIYAVIGCNYGDEGKGLVTDYLSSQSNKTLVVKHNGGAQAGHTVEIEDKRFVFHELSAGSFRKADTYWAETYYPDLFKLGEEITDFYNVSGFYPSIKAHPDANITYIDDILINMLLETSRKEERHGSCGMGINEADLRQKAGFRLSIGEIKRMNHEDLFTRLKSIREKYSLQRLKEENYDKESEYYLYLNDDNVLLNFAKDVLKNVSFVEIVEDTKALFENYENIIFETGQGLLLDSENEDNWPNVTASRTGIYNTVHILDKYGMKPDVAAYVTRSYVTRHGAGRLINEKPFIKDKYNISDKTNITNEWQGSLRFASFESVNDLSDRIFKDINGHIEKHLYITHLNETNDKILVNETEVAIKDYIENLTGINKVFVSDTCYSKDIHEHSFLL